MRIKEIKAKSVITKSGLPDADFVLNPYIGCQHGCIYCYADFMRKFTGHDLEEWGSFVDVKINAPEKITPKSIKEGAGILIGSVTDPYQPLEAKYKITRRCIEKLLEFQPRLEILTKSSLILRDLDLLKQFKDLKVGISLGVLDEILSRKLEPYAPSPKIRLETLRRLNKEGIRTYLFVSPIFPEITDYEELISLSRDYIDEVLFENLNIRANNRKKIFEFLREKKPELIPLYEKLQKKDSFYWNNLEKRIAEYCERHKIPFRIYFHHETKKKNKQRNNRLYM
ncbi:MAG: radical SAM protein [Candidatus Pacearchaeota archaeon]